MKQVIKNYSFDKTAKTVTFSDFSTIRLDRILIITNVTRNIIIYNFADPNLGGSVATNVLTLTYDTSAMANTDKLQIFYELLSGDPYDDPAMKVDGTATTQPVSGTVSVSGVATATKQSDGSQKTQIVDGSGNVIGSTSNALDINIKSGTLGSNQSVNVAQINGVTPLMGAGNTGTGSPRVTIASDQAVIPVSDNGSSLTVDYATTGSGTATGALRVELPTNGTGVVGLNAGTNAIGKLAANSGVDIGDVDVTSISAGTNLIGDVDVAPRTTGGWSVGNFTSGDTYTALTNSAQVIKGSAGKFGGYYIYNPNSAATYVMVYNIAAASVTVGTSTAKLVFCIPASSGANLELLAGIPFDTAMSIAAATTGGGNTAPTTALEAMVFYK